MKRALYLGLEPWRLLLRLLTAPLRWIARAPLSAREMAVAHNDVQRQLDEP